MKPSEALEARTCFDRSDVTIINPKCSQFTIVDHRAGTFTLKSHSLCHETTLRGNLDSAAAVTWQKLDGKKVCVYVCVCVCVVFSL